MTVLIVARDAAATIERAIRSAVSENPDEIVLVDDWSSDDTVALARAAAPGLRVVRPPEHRTLGLARQTGIEALRTPLCVCLDADDELMRGRVARMKLALETAAVAADAIELRDGETGRLLREAGVPEFVLRDPLRARLFERNYLPAPGPLGFRRNAALRIGYDVSLHDDFDFVLRCLAARLPTAILTQVGYRQYALPSSMSRCLGRQREMYRRTLIKHAYADVLALYGEAGWPPAVAAWGLVSMATFRGEYECALQFVEDAARAGGADDIVLETDGPCARSERWRVLFHRGTLLLLMGRPHDAIAHLEAADDLDPSAESSNNLGVARAMAGRGDLAAGDFLRAAEMFPGYQDARLNTETRTAFHITTHPMRRHAARLDYRPGMAVGVGDGTSC